MCPYTITTCMSQLVFRVYYATCIQYNVFIKVEIHLHSHLCVCVCACVCACECVWERKRERESLYALIIEWQPMSTDVKSTRYTLQLNQDEQWVTLSIKMLSQNRILFASYVQNKIECLAKYKSYPRWFPKDPIDTRVIKSCHTVTQLDYTSTSQWHHWHDFV